MKSQQSSNKKPAMFKDKDWNVSTDCPKMTNSILVNELELTVATGGTEGSCYRCTLPFGVVLLVIGIAVTTVAFSFNSHASTITILGLVLLSSSILLLSLTAVCWKLQQGKEIEMRSASQTTLTETLRDSCNWIDGIDIYSLKHMY